jgi:hypothetical protein
MSIDEQLDRILRLEDDFDEDGGSRFRRETADKVKGYIPEIEKMIKLWGLNVGEPKITPAAKGGIDVHYKDDKYEFLANVEDTGKCSYYFDIYQGEKMEGEL